MTASSTPSKRSAGPSGSTPAQLRTPAPAAVWAHLHPSNAAAIQRLASAHSAPSEPFDTEITHKAQAAVAVFLYEQEYDAQDAPIDWFPSGSRPDLAPAREASSASAAAGSADGARRKVLHVLMTTRALHLRSHPGQASLPGGKRDATDQSIEHTALRESVEEVGMGGWEAVGKEVHWLYTAAPLLSKTCLLVHPVVFFLSNPARTLANLRASPSEVSALWSVPLSLFLASSTTQEGALYPRGYVLADPHKVDTHRPPQHALRTYSDVPWLLGTPYRLHRFRSHQQLIKGLTADILIGLATAAYGIPARFPLRAEGQMGWEEMVGVVLKRLREGQRGESRWGDGESGDAQGSTEAYETVVGVDVPDSASAEAEEGLPVEDGKEDGKPAAEVNPRELASSLAAGSAAAPDSNGQAHAGA
ncbi:hypothetical protein OC842_001040 [Tilletia horrida]|uniref:Nudix hydrolase domain-containing protein n=1 Tax=Tilletia horrida TaxID=155126 RepID=A0AAN6GIE0_9BASI|nr:hypothetical protein OC842_001040 [Tilletia horrida]